MFNDIILDRRDGIAEIILNRPERLNAVSTETLDELIAAFDVTDADDDVRAVIVTGAGRGFCAGADLSRGAATFDFASHEALSGPRRDGGGRLTLRLFQSLKPIIGAINGPAAGIGANMLLPMDFRLASTSAKFGFVFVRRGVVPEGASSWFLPRVVGLPNALDWVLTGRMVSVDEALAKGLVGSVHEPDALMTAARDLARTIADNCAPVSVALARQMLWRLSAADDPMAAHRIDSRGMVARGASADAAEGVQAWKDKRAAAFPDRVSKDMPAFHPWWSERPFE